MLNSLCGIVLLAFGKKEVVGHSIISLIFKKLKVKKKIGIKFDRLDFIHFNYITIIFYFVIKIC